MLVRALGSFHQAQILPSSSVNVFSSFWYATLFLVSSSSSWVLTTCVFIHPSCVASSVVSSLFSLTAVFLSTSWSVLMLPTSSSSLSPSPSASLLASLSALKPSSRASFRGWVFLLEVGLSVSCSCSTSASSRRRFLAIGQPRMLNGGKEKGGEDPKYQAGF